MRLLGQVRATEFALLPGELAGRLLAQQREAQRRSMSARPAGTRRSPLIRAVRRSAGSPRPATATRSSSRRHHRRPRTAVRGTARSSSVSPSSAPLPSVCPWCCAWPTRTLRRAGSTARGIRRDRSAIRSTRCCAARRRRLAEDRLVAHAGAVRANGTRKISAGSISGAPPRASPAAAAALRPEPEERERLGCAAPHGLGHSTCSSTAST